MAKDKHSSLLRRSTDGEKKLKTSNFFEQANQKKLFELSCDILNIKQVSIF
jgi:hypothetical protein